MGGRQTKSPRARAEEALAIADRLVARLQAKRRVVYLRGNPDLAPVAQDEDAPDAAVES